jgi:hypothetical protein
MGTRLFRIVVLTALAPIALGGAFGHVDGFETLSHGTFLFPPDHPAHAPFVPSKEHPCAACAVANLLPPATAPAFLSPPEVRLAHPVHATHVERAPILPELPARSPPCPALA